MTNSEAHDFTWGEETITELVLVGASPRVRAIPFTKTEEGGSEGTGADWLWWWIGADGEAFGMLVQAKRLKKRKNGSWDIDFTYKSGGQRERLFTTAKKLQVAATYVLYFGSPSYRNDVEDWAADHPLDWEPSEVEKCEGCKRKTVSFLAAHVTRSWVWRDAMHAYALATPIENLADPTAEMGTPKVIPTLTLGAELYKFINQPQVGPRKVAKGLLAQAMEVRQSQFSLGVTEGVEAIPDNKISEAFVFESLPDDRDHSSIQYFPEILRGLRTTLPAYVLDLLHGDISDSPEELGLDPEEQRGLAGVVVVDDRSESKP